MGGKDRSLLLLVCTGEPGDLVDAALSSLSEVENGAVHRWGRSEVLVPLNHLRDLGTSRHTHPLWRPGVHVVPPCWLGPLSAISCARGTTTGQLLGRGTPGTTETR